ncbi:hypothetical protein F5Y14DRAFT_417774 [Nemania sp. NC0429]|nr:hypothetical protein F5Y14DRAFT_417774 [Nemania sp. NC0429]
MIRALCSLFYCLVTTSITDLAAHALKIKHSYYSINWHRVLANANIRYLHKHYGTQVKLMTNVVPALFFYRRWSFSTATLKPARRETMH